MFTFLISIPLAFVSSLTIQFFLVFLFTISNIKGSFFKKTKRYRAIYRAMFSKEYFFIKKSMNNLLAIYKKNINFLKPLKTFTLSLNVGFVLFLIGATYQYEYNYALNINTYSDTIPFVKAVILGIYSLTGAKGDFNQQFWIFFFLFIYSFYLMLAIYDGNIKNVKVLILRLLNSIVSSVLAIFIAIIFSFAIIYQLINITSSLATKDASQQVYSYIKNKDNFVTFYSDAKYNYSILPDTSEIKVTPLDKKVDTIKNIKLNAINKKLVISNRLKNLLCENLKKETIANNSLESTEYFYKMKKLYCNSNKD